MSGILVSAAERQIPKGFLGRYMRCGNAFFERVNVIMNLQSSDI